VSVRTSRKCRGLLFHNRVSLNGVAILLPLLSVASVPAADSIIAPAPKSEMSRHSDIRYAEVKGVDPNLLSLDIYGSKASVRHPVIVMIHGGGWRGGDKASPGVADTKAACFVPLGYTFVSINYRLSPAVRHPVHVQDVAKALAFVHNNITRYGGDPGRIFVMGHSAGAHLAALVATDESYLKAEGKTPGILKGVILLDGAGYDVPRQYGEGGLLLKTMYKDAFTADPAAQKSASPVSHVGPGKGTPPFLIFHLANRLESKWQSDKLAQTLQLAGIPATVVPAKDRTHASLNRLTGTPGDETTRLITRFLANPPQPQSRPAGTAPGKLLPPSSPRPPSTRPSILWPRRGNRPNR
jgi:arylformamidase